MEAVESIALALEHMQEAMRVMKVQMERTDETVRDVAQGLTTQGEIIQKIDLRMELFERRASPVPSAAFACCAAPPAPALAFPAHAHAHAHARAPAGAALPPHVSLQSAQVTGTCDGLGDTLTSRSVLVFPETAP